MQLHEFINFYQCISAQFFSSFHNSTLSPRASKYRNQVRMVYFLNCKKVFPINSSVLNVAKIKCFTSSSSLFIYDKSEMMNEKNYQRLNGLHHAKGNQKHSSVAKIMQLFEIKLLKLCKKLNLLR